MSMAVGNTALAYARVWHLVDAKGQILGRMSTQIAKVLIGKHKPIYDPASDCGDYIVVINAKHIEVSGRKYEQKVYRRHTTRPGGLKVTKFSDVMETNPEFVVEHAVSGMLPKNKLRDVRMKRLFVFPEDEHPYKANIFKTYDGSIPLDIKPISN
ncbi:hypothetical protein BB559_003652 [Furculomyces boomerangus]|uniref:Ribosomal protein L13 n=2 Tax=Harpellales TaxID=61421 RepID=A0A2T9YJV0_9FUNG|nr:hypothetical protein BB559_003652 [Furculomyces boomerangus]PWA02601.1 hypothetical protein BB558_001261 [Smittium angustum]